MWRIKPKSLEAEESFVFIQIILDFLLLTGLIHYSGGIDNPFYFFYIFHIIIASTIFKKLIQPFLIAGAAVLMFSVMVFLEQIGFLENYSADSIPLETGDLIVPLVVFYLTLFASSYLSITLIRRHRKVKDLIYEQNLALEKADHDKTQFFRFVSHELKRPIVATQSAVNVVLENKKEDLSVKAKDMLQRARNRTDQMLSIIKDLVDLSYDRSLLDHKPEKVIPSNYLYRFIEDQRLRAEEKELKIVTRIDEETGNLRLDKFMLEKVFSNLFSNAIQYTPEGGTITITGKWNRDSWSLKVKDTGIGIDAGELNKIFNEFYRAKNAKRYEAIGTGLGLSIVKRMVDESGGTITVKSKVGTGTEFTVEFPIK
jgi:signal transduction histidine kinase